MLNNEQSATNGWAVPREFPIQALKMHNLAGVRCVLQEIRRGRAGQVDDTNSCCTLASAQEPHVSAGAPGSTQMAAG